MVRKFKLKSAKHVDLCHILHTNAPPSGTLMRPQYGRWTILLFSPGLSGGSVKLPGTLTLL